MRLCGCPGCSESSLSAQSFCWFCHVAARNVRMQCRTWSDCSSLSCIYTVSPDQTPPLRAVWAATWQNQQNECAPSEDSYQPDHPPSLIRVFAVRMKKAWVLSYPLSAQRRLWSDWADAQADLSLRWAQMPFCWFCHEAAHLLYGKQCRTWPDCSSPSCIFTVFPWSDVSFKSSLVWICNVCPDLSVRKLRTVTVLLDSV